MLQLELASPTLPALAAGDTIDFGDKQNLYFAASAAPLIAERLMGAWRLRQAQALESEPR